MTVVDAAGLGGGAPRAVVAPRLYPDTRDMGNPFARPFAGPVETTVLGVSSAAGRSLTIRQSES